jgi:hypothetical protein
MTHKILWAIPFAAALTACDGADDTTGTTTAAAQIATTGEAWPPPVVFQLATIR